MPRKSKVCREPTLAATVASEDLACGDFVAVLNESVELPSYCWDGSGTSLPPDQLVRLKVIPANAGLPLRVVVICLPFVYAKPPRGSLTTIDTRRVQLIRLDRDCAKTVWKELRSGPCGFDF